MFKNETSLQRNYFGNFVTKLILPIRQLSQRFLPGLGYKFSLWLRIFRFKKDTLKTLFFMKKKDSMYTLFNLMALILFLARFDVAFYWNSRHSWNWRKDKLNPISNTLKKNCLTFPNGNLCANYLRSGKLNKKEKKKVFKQYNRHYKSFKHFYERISPKG